MVSRGYQVDLLSQKGLQVHRAEGGKGLLRVLGFRVRV